MLLLWAHISLAGDGDEILGPAKAAEELVPRDDDDFDFDDLDDLGPPPEIDDKLTSVTETDIYIHRLDIMGDNWIGFSDSRLSHVMDISKNIRIGAELSLDHLFESQKRNDEPFKAQKFISEGHVHIDNIKIMDKNLIARIGKQQIIIGQGLSGVLLLQNPYFGAKTEKGVLAARVDVTDLTPDALDLDRFEVAVFESGEDFVRNNYFEQLNGELGKYFTAQEIEALPQLLAAYLNSGAPLNGESIGAMLTQTYPARDFTGLNLQKWLDAYLYGENFIKTEDLFRYHYPDWKPDGGLAYSINIDKKLGRSGFLAVLSHTSRENKHLNSGKETMQTAGLRYISRNSKFRAWIEFIRNKNNPVFAPTGTKYGATTGFVWRPFRKLVVGGEAGYAENNFSSLGFSASYLPSCYVENAG